MTPVNHQYPETVRVSSEKHSIGTVGDSYDCEMGESTIGLYRTELVKREGPWCWRDLDGPSSCGGAEIGPHTSRLGSRDEPEAYRPELVLA